MRFHKNTKAMPKLNVLLTRAFVGLSLLISFSVTTAQAATLNYHYVGADLTPSTANGAQCPASVGHFDISIPVAAQTTFRAKIAGSLIKSSSGASLQFNGSNLIGAGVAYNGYIGANYGSILLDYFNFSYLGLSATETDQLSMNITNSAGTISATCSYSSDSLGNWSLSFESADNGDCGCSSSGNPINSGTGNKFQTETDFTAAANTHIGLTRYYNSQDVAVNAAGAGWRNQWLRSISGSIASGTAIHTREDGRAYTYINNAAGAWVSDPNVTSILTAITNSGGQQTGWRVVREDDSVETYTVAGLLSSVTTRSGLVTTLNYDANNHLTTVTGPFGHTLTFTYTGNLITQIKAPDGGIYRYTYDANNNLTAVTYPDGKKRQYLYENTSFVNALTGIVDELGNRYATYSYDSQGRAISSQHAGGAELTSVTYNTDGSATVVDANNNTHTTSFVTNFNKVDVAAVAGVPYLQAGASAYTYDANGFVASSTDWNGNVTTYVNNTRGLPTSRTEASGTALARTIATAWHPTFHLPIQITEPSGVSGVNRVSTFGYDTHGNLSRKTITAGGLARTWKYTYNTAGQPLTAADPNGNITSFAYDSQGGLAKTTNALGQVTTYVNDADGRPVTITDPNGLVTKIAYTPRGQVASRAVGQEATSYTYTKNNQLQSVTRPDGSYLDYSYNAAHQLIGINDALGNTITYTLDLMGNVTAQQVYDTSGTLRRNLSHTYDAVNRLASDIGAYPNETTSYGRDANGNITSITDPNSNITANSFDALNRLTAQIDPNHGRTNTAYNADDSIASITDPRGVVTHYVYDGLGNQTEVISPDSGVTTRTFDAVGNVLTSTDARGEKTTNTYDKLNRLTKQLYADFTSTTFGYDQGSNGVGRLTTMTDPSGSTTWTFDVYGHNLVKTQTTGSVTLIATNTYNAATGQLLTSQLPSGTVISYGYDVNGNPNSIKTGTVSIVTEVAYDPFGSAKQWTQGGTLNHARSTDLDGRLTGIGFANSSAPAGEQIISLSRDPGGRITQMTDNTTATQTFGYDGRNQITAYTTPSLTQDYSYDANGNRTALSTITSSNGATNYTYAAASDHLTNSNAGATFTNFTLDAAGNLTDDGQRQFSFNARNLLARSVKSNVATLYILNGFGERVAKTSTTSTAINCRLQNCARILRTNTPVTTIYTRNAQGNITGEYNAAGVAQQETVYLGNLPVGVIKSGALYYINPDHLGAPHTITTSDATQAPVWTWNHDPFGNGAPTVSGNFTYNNRFPGQTYDAETGLIHNNARDYNPATGRYIESDPIGLRGGLNTYTYVGGNPISKIDRNGTDYSEFSKGDGLSALEDYLNMLTKMRDDTNLNTILSQGNFQLDYSLVPNSYMQAAQNEIAPYLPTPISNNICTARDPSGSGQVLSQGPTGKPNIIYVVPTNDDTGVPHFVLMPRPPLDYLELHD